MSRFASRRPGQRGRDREEYAEEQAPKAKDIAEPRQSSEGDNAIAEMARGFVEAQSKLNTEPAMLVLLEKISRQLEELRQRPSGNMAGGQSAGKDQAGGQALEGIQSPAGQAAISQQAQAQGKSAPGADDLAAIFSSLLQGAGADSQNNQGNLAAAGSQKDQGSKAQGTQASTAAQALAQAQYELANELENSLDKLKKVITESEKLANKISNLLGQENGENPS